MKSHAGQLVAIDTAGGAGGGAGRFRSELVAYLARTGRVGVASIGAGKHITPKWLFERERLSWGYARTVAANNICYAVAGRERWVLTRNANHFLTANEWAAVAHLHPAGFDLQVQVVRTMVRRADRIVVPTSEMGARVATIMPRLADRIVVRFHPFSPPKISRVPEPVILCPIVDSPYKRLATAMEELAQAIAPLPGVTVVWTSTRADAPISIQTSDRFELIGIVDREVLSDLYSRAAAIYYPTAIESFGYPLAEARALGIPIIARDTSRTREIAGGALVPFAPGHVPSLNVAVDRALIARPTPEPGPFDPDSYFDWMFG